MKNSKHIGLRALTFIALIAGSYFAVQAMTAGDKTIQVFTPQWYTYTGPPMSSTDPLHPYDPNNANNYSPFSGPGTSPSCSGDEQVCAIKLNPNASDPSRPDQNELDQLDDEISNQTEIVDQLMFKPAE